MGEFSAKNFTQNLVEDIEETLRPIQEVDAYQFLIGDEYLNENPTPLQSVVIKTLYGLWQKYPPSEEEMVLIELARTKWKIEIDFYRDDPIVFLILVLGRRSTKSTLMSFIATYEAYTLICKGNPQEYYGIRKRHSIHIMHVAAAGDQAQDVFSLTYDNIRRVKFFKKYIDFDKDSSTELRLYTPYDNILNEQIRRRNNTIPRGRGLKKESLLPGSITIESVKTSSASTRGKSVKCLLLSEFAHFQRGKVGGEDGIMSASNPSTDYAIWTALVPSVLDFNKGEHNDGRVLAESSPKEKGGEFYNQYCIGGGMEQEDFESIVPAKGYQVLQYATWEARPGFTYDDFEPAFKRDPVGAGMEWGAHFSNPSGQFISEEVIERIPIGDRESVRINFQHYQFVISIDPGGKAKKKVADTYAVAWGHSEGMDKEDMYFYSDGMEGFDATVRSGPGGQIERIPVDPLAVIDFLLLLIKDLGGKNFIKEIVYDQFDSSVPVAILQRHGFPAVETFFTNKYKSEMYGNFLTALNLLKFKSYGVDTAGWVARLKLELKYLQRITRGEYTYYEHPKSGPVQHDDFADANANLVHRLTLLYLPTKQSVQNARKHGLGPQQIKRTVVPVIAAPLHGGGGLGITRSNPRGRSGLPGRDRFSH